MKTFAELMAGVMLRTGENAPAMARRLGVTVSAVRQWQQGLCTPTAAAGRGFAQAYGEREGDVQKAIELSRICRRAPRLAAAMRSAAAGQLHDAAKAGGYGVAPIAMSVDELWRLGMQNENAADVGWQHARPMTAAERHAAVARAKMMVAPGAVFSIELDGAMVPGGKASAICANTPPATGKWALIEVEHGRVRFDVYDKALYGGKRAFAVRSILQQESENENG